MRSQYCVSIKMLLKPRCVFETHSPHVSNCDYGRELEPGVSRRPVLVPLKTCGVEGEDARKIFRPQCPPVGVMWYLIQRRYAQVSS
ncbi:hypothetical protein TNCV_1184011 [Trichonephila clavipes]|nr:hypothetical protein TNCV_1184011 [Trichonephila clavipes]